MAVLDASSDHAGQIASRWHGEAFADERALRRFAENARTIFPTLDRHHDVEWIAVAHDWPSNELLVLVDREDNRIVGMAPFAIAQEPLIYALGPFELLRLNIRQFKLYQDVTTMRAVPEEAIASCFEVLVQSMPRVVCASSIPIGSDLHRQLLEPTSAVRRHFYVLPWGGESPHCRIRWEGNFEKYLASIGKVSRKDLRRNARALFTDTTLDAKVRRFQSPEDVDVFLQDGISVSDKTYQKRDLGLGISLGGPLERVMRYAAAHNGFLGYILYINGTPAAFEYALLCGKTCTMMQAGYDPTWAGRQIGSVLFFEVLRDFERIGLRADWLDLLPGINLFKLRVANDKRQIRRFYLFSRTPAGTILFLTLMATDWLSRAVGALVAGHRDDDLQKYLARAKTGWRKKKHA